MNRRVLAVARPVGGTAVLAAVLWRLGPAPFAHGLRAVDARALIAGVCIGAMTTICSAWRWRIVARRHGLALDLRPAVAACYRSVFLNLTLPGGVVGDVHRGLAHGRSLGAPGRGLRAVAWERGIGQVVQVALTAAALLILPSPVHPPMPVTAAVIAAILIGLPVAAVRGSRAVGRRQAAGIAAASLAVVAGNAAMFLIAARTAGVAAPLGRMAPLALLVMAAAVLPSIAGWGPREGATAWAFGAAGLGAANGAAAAVVFGIMALASSLPGAVVLVAPWLGRTAGAARPQRSGAADA